MSDMRRRIQKLEQKMDTVNNSRCDRCGFPATAAMLHEIITDQPPEQRSCSACGRQLTLDGQPLPNREDGLSYQIYSLTAATWAAL